MRWIGCAAVVAIVLGALGPSALAEHNTPLYRGGIAWNDYGYGPTGGYRAAMRNNRLASNGWSGLGGYSSYRPYYNHWSGNVGLGFGRPYYGYSFGYYSGPLFADYYYSPYYGAYGPGYYDYYGYGTYYSPRSNFVDYYLPPVYYPAELAYGPQAVKQFLGVDRTFGLGPLLNDQPVVNQPIVIERRDTAREVAKPVVQEIDWDARKKADRYIELGDNLFREQKFHDALLRYRLAVQASPDYAVAYVRHGFSLVAHRRYDEAADAFTKAFTLDRQIVASGFRIDQMYDDNLLAREAHEEALAQAVLDAPSDGKRHFVMGMWLVFSGQADRSRKFFEEARALGVNTAVVERPVDGARDL